jgi:hypothetical protein
MPPDENRALSGRTAGERRASAGGSSSGDASGSPPSNTVRFVRPTAAILRWRRPSNWRARVWGSRALARNATESAAVGAGVDVCASTCGARRTCGTRRTGSTRRATRAAAACVARATSSTSGTAARATRSALSTAIQGGRRRTRSAGERRCFRPFVDTSGHAQEPARGEKHTPSIHCGHSFHLSHPKVFGEAVGETRAA